jgi:peptidoglycan/xylan/chitin deacetylase (PgdA/CDA1 family)
VRFALQRFRRALIVAAKPMSAFRPPRDGQILTFHDIDSRGAFAAFLAWLSQRCHVVTLDELLEKSQSKKPRVALTFDDGYAEWSDFVAALLISRRLPATFFVSSGFVDLRGLEAQEFARARLGRTKDVRPLSLRQLCDLAASPEFEIGSHTVHHVDLGLECSRAAMREEIEPDRDRLQEWTGTAVRWFAFPFGQPQNLSEQATAVLREVGFRGALTTIPGLIKESKSEFELRREPIDTSASRLEWSAVLAGGYDRVFRLKHRLAGFQSRHLPLSRGIS